MEYNFDEDTAAFELFGFISEQRIGVQVKSNLQDCIDEISFSY